MKKQYRLLIDSPSIPKGTIVTLQNNGLFYVEEGEETQHQCILLVKHVENRPTMWELINEKVENEYLPFVPALSQKYWFISSTGKVESDTVCGHPVDTLRVTNSVVFRTEQGAKYEALRRESMSNRWKPDFEEDYYYYSFNHKRIYNPEWKKGEDDIRNYFIGNVHRTEKDCTQWADKYAEAWRVLL